MHDDDGEAGVSCRYATGSIRRVLGLRAQRLEKPSDMEDHKRQILMALLYK
jgi:hypothetical protein